MKQPTDKDIRLYASLSDVDSQFILDSTIPLKAAPVPPAKKASKPTLWDYLRRPQYASVALAALLVTLTVVALLVTGITKGPQTEPPPHGIPTTDPIGSVKIPTAEDAAALRKGMNLSELVSLMGNDYTQEGTRYTFTLDTGEQLTVSTAPSEAGETAVAGFEWLGSAGETYNPMGIPAEILQKVQEYATDRVIPVYTVPSLIGKYNQTLTLPSAEEVLEGAAPGYLRVSADGSTVTLDAEGAETEVNVSADAFTEDISALFDESVRIKAYYPIATTLVAEGEAVYLQTSIGDYILYLHREFELVLAGEDLPAPVPYLVPVGMFHEFAYGMVDKSASYGIGWGFTEERMTVIEPYKMTAEGYWRPVNLATPEAADGVKTDMEHSAVVELLGPCLRCASESHIYAEDDPMANYEDKALEGLHYWELTDGSGLILYCLRKASVHYQGGNPPEYISSVPVNDVIRAESAEVFDSLGTATPATFALLQEGRSKASVEALVGPSLESSLSSLWKCSEQGVVHTVSMTWRAPTGYIGPTYTRIKTIEYTTVPVAEAAQEIEMGMAAAHVFARLGTCLCGHQNGSAESRYHSWTLPDGRILSIYIGTDVPAWTSPLSQSVLPSTLPLIVMDILWQVPDNHSPLGTPGLFMAEQVRGGMKEETILALLGQPTATAASLASAWEWNEDGKTYALTVYWNDNIPKGIFQNFKTVARCELTEGPLSIPIPEKEPSAADAASVTLGMSAVDVLKIMGSGNMTTLGNATLYCWTLTDGVFCAVAEPDPADPTQGERFVTYTFYRDSYEDVSAPTLENMRAVNEGMSAAQVVALLGQPNNTVSNGWTVVGAWGTTSAAQMTIEVLFETVTNSESHTDRLHAKTVKLIQPLQ